MPPWANYHLQAHRAGFAPELDPGDLPGGEPFRFLRGGLLSFANAIVWWQDQFKFATP